MKWSTDHEVKIVNRMLELSLIQSGMDKTEPAFRKFSPRHVIDLILKSKKYYNEAEIALRIPPEISIVSDMDYCHEIFAEILSNAVQYSNPPRKIEITYNESTDAVCFSFRDNGIGLSQEDINNIFHPFYIADAPKLSRKYGRMGLGLSLAKERVATLGGEIRVNSEIGHGSTFTIQLPKVEIKVR
jgi:signal transduction histidine kinase